MKNFKIVMISVCVLLFGIQVQAQIKQTNWLNETGNPELENGIIRNGDVGIGAPYFSGARLHIYNNVHGHHSFRLDHRTGTDYGYAMLIRVDTDLTKAFNIQTTEGASIFRVMGNGVVNAKKIWAEEIEVSVTAMTEFWPDYVFAEAYKLKSLQELELYISENGHLPEIPSAEDVEEKGINLAEMDAALLKKIEELTLYIIQQEKRIADLESKVNNN